MFTALFLATAAHADVTDVIAFNNDATPSADATLVVLLECSSLPHAPKSVYGTTLSTFADEIGSLQAVLVDRRIGDRIVRITNPTQAELDAVIPKLRAPNNGLWGTAILAVAAPGFGADFGLESVMCTDFDVSSTATPDGNVPFESTLLNVAPLREAVFAASSTSFALLDTSPDMTALVDFPVGITAKGISADNWNDENGFAMSAAGPNKNAKPGLLTAVATVLRENATRDLTTVEFRGLVHQEAFAVDSSIMAYDNVTGSFTDPKRVLFRASATAPTTKVTTPKKSAVAPIAAFATAGACLIGSAVLTAEATSMFDAMNTKPETYDGENFTDVSRVYDGYRYGAVALGACTLAGTGLGITFLW